jgi:hypothetical protein
VRACVAKRGRQLKARAVLRELPQIGDDWCAGAAVAEKLYRDQGAPRAQTPASRRYCERWRGCWRGCGRVELEGEAAQLRDATRPSLPSSSAAAARLNGPHRCTAGRSAWYRLPRRGLGAAQETRCVFLPLPPPALAEIARESHIGRVSGGGQGRGAQRLCVVDPARSGIQGLTQGRLEIPVLCDRIPTRNVPVTRECAPNSKTATTKCALTPRSFTQLNAPAASRVLYYACARQKSRAG